MKKICAFAVLTVSMLFMLCACGKTIIPINRLSAKGTDEVMKPATDGLPFFIFICYTHLAGCWHTTEPGEVSGGAV